VVKLLLKRCGSPTSSTAEIQIPVSRQVAILHVKLFFVVFFSNISLSFNDAVLLTFLSTLLLIFHLRCENYVGLTVTHFNILL